MNRRPLFLICIGLMILIVFLKIAGAPIFGVPAMETGQRKLLEDGCMTEVEGTVSSRSVRQNSVQYILSNSVAAVRGRKIHFSKIQCTTLGDTRYFSALDGDGAGEAEYALAPGSRVRVTGTLSEIPSAGNPGQFDERSFYGCEGIWYRMFADKVIIEKSGAGLAEILTSARERITQRTEEMMSSESASVLSSMAFGDRSHLSDETRQAYRTGGVSHILAISGLHISLVGMLVYEIILYAGLPIWASACVSFSLTLIYCFFCGSPVSALRALIMFGVLLGSRVARKSYDLLCALSLAGILLLLTQPGVLFYAGFQLTFAAVLGAAVVYPAFLGLIPVGFWKKGSRKRKALEKLIEATLSWGSITAATLPLICRYFYEVPVYGLPVNLLIVPLAGFVLLPGLAGGILALHFTSLPRLILLPVDYCLRFFSFAASLAGRIPGAVLITGQPSAARIVISYLLLGAAVALARRIRRRERSSRHETKRLYRFVPVILLGVFLTVLLVHMPSDFSLTMLDVGQGDSLSVVIPDRKTALSGEHVFLVDGGSTDIDQVGKYRIIPYLKQQGIRSVDAVFLSHEDADHTNGIEELLVAIGQGDCAIRVGKVCMPYPMQATDVGQRIEKECRSAGCRTVYLKEGDRITAGEGNFEVLHPFRSGGGTTGNAGSMVLRLTYRNFSALLTGDLEGEGEEECLPLLEKTLCLKVAHHGSRFSTSEEFLRRVDPKICLIPAPRHSTYGHPHRELLDRLKETGASVFVTKDGGAIRVTCRRKKMIVETWRKKTP